jgi:hypothetical protein
VGGVCAGFDGGALELPHKHCHVRLAQLAYNGTPQDTDMAGQAANDIDLVVARSAGIRSFIRAASPDTPQLVYSNASNIYGNWEGNTLANGGLLVSWLNYADAWAAAGEDRESGFYHCAMTTLNANGKNGCKYSVSGQSTVPVTWLWQVKAGPSTGGGTWTDYTAIAHGGGRAGSATWCSEAAATRCTSVTPTSSGR